MSDSATFSRRLAEHLGFPPDADRSAGRAPFELIFADGRELDWTETSAARSGEGLSARFVHAAGLRAQLRARSFPDSRAVEVSGEIANEGSETFSGVSGCCTVRLFLELGPDWVDARVRSWRGARTIPNFPSFFPPIDFAVDTRQLVSPLAPVQLAVSGGSDGRSSSADLPFALLAGRRGGIAVAVEWSGTWFACLEQDPGAQGDAMLPARLDAGVWALDLDLRPGQSLPLPTVLLAPYTGDVAEGGNALRRHVRRHVAPRLGGEEVLPPAAFNSWFGFENDYTERLMRPAVDAAAAVGLEYFVVDGGWHEGGFPMGVGNWDTPDPAKFPDGVRPLSDYVRSKGLRYGTWFEPEFAHADSALHRARPEWFFPVPSDASVDYGQWVKHNRFVFDAHWAPGDFRMLDFGLPEVQEYWVDRIGTAYRDWGMRWVRLDCNNAPLPRWKAASEPGWAQIRHVQGLYRVWDHLLDAFPDLMIEQCAAGGLRIDLGTVRRGHVIWMNDHTTHTDVVRRLQTQLNHVLPGNYPNTNLCQPRHDFTDYDYLSHGCGPFGYSGRIWEAPARELERYAGALARFKGYRHLLLGDYACTLEDPDDRFGREVHAWSEGGQELVMEFNGATGAGTASARVEG